MDLTPIQQNFAAGELSERFLIRTDMKGWDAGVRKMINMVPLPQGPTTRRMGSFFREKIPVGYYAKVVPFPIDSRKGFIVVIGAKEGDDCVAWSVKAKGGSYYQTVENNDAGFYNPSAWTKETNGSATIGQPYGACQMAVNSDRPGSYARVWQDTLDSNQTTDLTLRVRTYERGRESVLRVRVVLNGTTELLNETFTGTEFTAQFTGSGSNGNHLQIYIELNADDQPEGAERVARELSVCELVRTQDAYIMDYIEYDGPEYTPQDLRELQYDISPDGTQMVFVSRNHPPWMVSYNRFSGNLGSSFPTFTNEPPEWTAQPNNYPGSIYFFDGRMWLGGTKWEPHQFWASVPGSYFDFTIDLSDTGIPLSAIDYIIKRYQRIRWMSGLRDLMIGTDSGEFTVKSLDGDAMHPKNINITHESQHGSRRRQPELVGNNILFVSPDGRKLRDTGYRWQEEGWVARDLTYVSDTITDYARNLNELYSAQNPDSLLYCVTDSGQLLIATYEWNNNVVGWSRHETDGFIMSACVIENGNRSRIWMAVQRLVDGQIEMHLEELVVDNYLDDALLINHITPVTTVIGLDHLEGETVKVMTDDAVHPDRTVTGGEITLNWEAKKVLVGRGYTSEIETLPLDMAIQTGSGTSTKKRRNKIWVRLMDSALPLIYSERPADRTPATPMNTPEPIFSGDRMVVNLGHDQYQQVTIKQDLPLPLTLLGIYGEAVMEKL